MDCARHPGVDAPYQCSRCREFICVDCETKVEGRSYCRACLANIHQRLAAQYEAETRNANYFVALLAGVAAAALMALVISQIAVWTGYSVHFGPALMGGAVGYAVLSGSGGKRGEGLQRMAFLLAIGGCIIAFFVTSLRMQPLPIYGQADFNSPVGKALADFPSYLRGQDVGLVRWIFVVIGAALAWWIPQARHVPD
jgi:hypothetical protein